MRHAPPIDDEDVQRARASRVKHSEQSPTLTEQVAHSRSARFTRDMPKGGLGKQGNASTGNERSGT
eukprot:9681636-Alexandrium_andersonii.AAC.1